jgi:hypothetical protein
MTPDRTSEGKWVLYQCATGKRLERWPVDARAMLASGDYTADPSNGQVPAATVAAAPEALAAPPIPIPVPAEHSPGVPLVVTKSTDAGPAQVSPIPSGQTSVAPKGRRGGK